MDRLAEWYSVLRQLCVLYKFARGNINMSYFGNVVVCDSGPIQQYRYL